MRTRAGRRAGGGSLQIALRHQVLGECLANDVWAGGLWIGLGLDQGIEWLKAVWMQPHLNRHALAGRLWPATFLWLQSFLRAHDNHGTKKTARQEGEISSRA